MSDNLKLSVDNVKILWSKTYNADGKPDWEHLFPYYHPEIVFKDSIQTIEGINEFKKMCSRLAKRCKKLTMDIYSIAHEDNIIFLEWKMTMVFRKSPDSPIFGCTRLKLHEDGRIIEQRDYFDLWGDIFNRVPGFRIAYRKFMKKIFG